MAKKIFFCSADMSSVSLPESITSTAAMVKPSTFQSPIHKRSLHLKVSQKDGSSF